MNNNKNYFLYVIKNISIITLTSLSGNIYWNVCNNIYNYKVNGVSYYKKYLKDGITSLNYGYF